MLKGFVLTFYFSGHEIEEIRCRALSCISTKFNLHLVDENNLENTESLLVKLLDYFNFESCPYEDKAVNLLRRLAGSHKFSSAVNHLGVNEVLRKLSAIESKVSPRYLKELSEIKDAVLDGNRKNSRMESSFVYCPEESRVHAEEVVKSHEAFNGKYIYITEHEVNMRL